MRRCGIVITMVLGLAVVGLGVLAGPGAGTASAHAVLERTAPAGDAVVAASPPRVTLTFGESVTLVPSAVRVYDGGLQRVDLGPADHADGDPATAGVALRPGLAAGTYTVTWRVVSADSHPVEGGFRFSVGRPGAAAAPPDRAAGGPAVGVVLGIARFVEYAGLAGLGGAVVLGWLSGAGVPAGGIARARRVVVTGWWLLLLGTVAAVALQGADAEGLTVASAADPGVVGATLATPVGVLGLARLALLALLAGIARSAPGAGRPLTGAGRIAAGAAAVGIAVTFSLGGHAGVGSWAVVGVVADAAHVLAMAPWLGGVAVLLAVLWTRPPDPDTAGPTGIVLTRFSRLAQIAVTVIVLTGVYQTWRHVGVPGALVATTYGWVLLAKILAVLVLLALGNLARTAVRRWSTRPVSSRPRTFALSSSVPVAEPAPPPVPLEDRQPSPVPAEPDVGAVYGLRRGLAAEVAVMVVVLGVTSALVATPQAAEAYAPAFTDVQAASGLVLDARVDAAHTGATTLHLTGRDPSGRPIPLSLVEGSLSLPAQQIGPLPLATAGGAADPAVPLSFAVPGRWAADVTVASPGVAPVLFRIQIPVR